MSKIVDSWNKRSQNLHKKAHLLKKTELRARGITRYDAELLLAQGYSLPESRANRRLHKNSTTASSGTDSLLTSNSGSNTSTNSSVTSSSDLTNNPSHNHPHSTRSKHKKQFSQKIPKLKLRLSRLSDTETDSSVVGTDTPQPLYEILDKRVESTQFPNQDSLVIDESSQSTIISQDENCSQSSLDDFNDQLDDCAFAPTCNVKRIRLKFDGKVDIVNLETRKT